MCFVITLLTLIILRRNEIIHITDFELILCALISELICVGYIIATKISLRNIKGPDDKDDSKN